MSKFSLSVRLGLIFTMTGVAFGIRAPIVIDGEFDDWASVGVAATDALGDSVSEVDLGRLWLSDDDDYLYLRFETTAEIDASENNELRLFIRGENGQELEWHLGGRTGVYRFGGSVTATSLDYTQIGFRQMPTVSTTVLEIGVALDAVPDGVNQLFSGMNVEVWLEERAGGDRLPDAGSISYVLGQGALPEETVIDFEKHRTSDLRIVTYNVLFDRIFNLLYADSFRRQIEAVRPDVINFQEIFGHTAEETRSLIEGWLPLEEGAQWYASEPSTEFGDTITVSRFPITRFWTLDALNSGTGNLAVELDTRELLGYYTIVINAHPPCCANDNARQVEVDQIIAFLRSGVTTEVGQAIEQNTPIIFAGDMNFVGRAQQPRTLLEGDIVNESNFGEDYVPDWDGSALSSVVPRHSESWWLHLD